MQWDKICGLRKACSSKARFGWNLPNRRSSSSALACTVTSCFRRDGHVMEIHSTIIVDIGFANRIICSGTIQFVFKYSHTPSSNALRAPQKNYGTITASTEWKELCGLLNFVGLAANVVRYLSLLMVLMLGVLGFCWLSRKPCPQSTGWLGSGCFWSVLATEPGIRLG